MKSLILFILFLLILSNSWSISFDKETFFYGINLGSFKKKLKIWWQIINIPKTDINNVIWVDSFFICKKNIASAVNTDASNIKVKYI